MQVAGPAPTPGRWRSVIWGGTREGWIALCKDQRSEQRRRRQTGDVVQCLQSQSICSGLRSRTHGWKKLSQHPHGPASQSRGARRCCFPSCSVKTQTAGGCQWSTRILWAWADTSFTVGEGCSVNQLSLNTPGSNWFFFPPIQSLEHVEYISKWKKKKKNQVSGL